jgi:Phytochelatin synthase
MKRRLLLSAVFVMGLLAAVPLVVAPVRVSPEAIEASVTRTPALLDRAWQLPVAATFQRAVTWQSNRSRCGPASVANVFRSFGDPVATEAAVLAGTGRCRTGFCLFGLTLDELADVARARPDRKVTVLRDLTPEAFREHLRRANDPNRRYIVNFSRAAIFGRGVGHHSPIGGYMEAEDLVFVLDVNRDFQPWLIERSRLFSALDTFDGDKKRGLLLIE